MSGNLEHLGSPFQAGAACPLGKPRWSPRVPKSHPTPSHHMGDTVRENEGPVARLA